jgi:hypothetical protein
MARSLDLGAHASFHECRLVDKLTPGRSSTSRLLSAAAARKSLRFRPGDVKSGTPRCGTCQFHGTYV